MFGGAVMSIIKIVVRAYYQILLKTFSTCDQLCAMWTLVSSKTNATVTSNQIYAQSIITAWRSYAVDAAFIRCCKKLWKVRSARFKTISAPNNLVFSECR